MAKPFKPFVSWPLFPNRSQPTTRSRCDMPGGYAGSAKICSHEAMRIGIVLGILCAPAFAGAATIMVGPNDNYTKIEMAQPGDEVVIAPGTYKFRVFLQQKGTPQKPVIIRAQDPNNKPV